MDKIRQDNERFFSAFKKLERAYTEHLLKNLKKFHLSPNEIEVISALTKTSSAREIALIADVSKGLVSRSVKSLRAKGYITTTLSDKDKREQYLALTEEGTGVLEMIECARDEFFETAFQHIEKIEREVFDALVNMMMQNLNIKTYIKE